MTYKHTGIKTVLIWLFLITTSAYALANIVRLGTNTLFTNGNWESKKVLLHKGVIGAVAYIVTRPALAGDMLHLGAWNGYQEVMYKTPISPLSITFKFLLERNAYLTFLFAGRDGAYSGIRFSSNPAYKNIRTHIDAEGKFIDKQGIQRNVVSTHVWHTVEITFSNNTYTAYLDNQIYDSGDENFSTAQKIGFRGSLKDAMVDNVVVIQRNGLPINREYFDNRNVIFTDFLISFVLLSIVNACLCLVLSKRSPKKFILSIVLKSNISLLTILAVLAMAVNLTATLYPTNPDKINWHGYISNEDTEEEALTTLKNAYSTIPAQNTKRILFIGTSQTWGAGVSSERNTFVQQLEQLLNSNKTNTIEYEVINAGVAGSQTSRLYQLYSSSWIQLKPDLVILNVSNNDVGTDNNDFRKSLTIFAELNRTYAIPTVFVLEPNSIENSLYPLETNHLVMKSVGQQYGIPVIDMQQALSVHYDDGFLWWDNVHLTDFGHFLFAKEFYSLFEQTVHF